MLAKLTGNSKHVFQVSTTILVGRSPYSREHNFDIIEHLCKISGELQASVADITTYQLFQSWFIDRHLAIFQALDFLGIHINAGHMGTHFGKTSAADQTDIAGTYNSYFHKSNT